MSQAQLYIGCPAWGQKAWVGTFFPARAAPRDFLRLYSQRCTCVEGNAFFHATPSAETIERWRQETPETFRFCPKVSQGISHAPRLDETREATLAFTARLRGLGTRLGPMFLQLPPSFSPAHLAQLETFLAFWPRDLRLAVEVRHRAFYSEPGAAPLYALLRQYQAAWVMMDTRPLRTGPTQEQRLLEARERKPDHPVQVALTTDFTLLRYIGHPQAEVNAPFLAAWAEQIGQWLTEGRAAYVFCHCPLDERAPTICADLYGRVSQVVALPPLPWSPAHALTPTQMRFDF